MEFTDKERKELFESGECPYCGSDNITETYKEGWTQNQGKKYRDIRGIVYHCNDCNNTNTFRKGVYEK